MGFLTDKIFPTGGLNTDADITKVQPGDYVDALNIQFEANGTAVTPVKGNLLKSTIAPVTASQKKSFYLTLENDGTTTHTVLFKTVTGLTIKSVTFTEGANNATSVTNFATATTAAAFLITPHPTSFGSILVSNGGTYPVVTLNTPVANGYDWILSSDDTTINILTEAYDESVVGEMNIIGSYDLLGDLFVVSTSQEKEVETTEFNAVSTSAGSSISITTATPHGLESGEIAIITGASGPSLINGSWVITAVTTTTIILRNSLYGVSYTGTITISKNTRSVSEIGVEIYSTNDDSYTYTTLLRTSEWGFRTSKQVDMVGEKTNTKVSMYITDWNVTPKVFYYKGAYVTNGALSTTSSSGIYAYGTINDETELILSSTKGVSFYFSQQLQSGGGLKAGMKKYFARLLSDSLTATSWIGPTNSVAVFAADQNGDPRAVFGSAPGATTVKVNEFGVSGVALGLYKYIELAVVEYTGGVVTASIVARELITSSTITIQHTGLETGVTNLAAEDLLSVPVSYQTARNISIIDSRLVLSNLTTPAAIDFSQVANKMRHSVKRRAIQGVGNPLANVTYSTGEYGLVENIYGFTGYMLNETYRFSARYELTNGYTTDAFWVDDIKISTGNTNVFGDPTKEGNPFSDNRRIVGLTNYDITAPTQIPSVYAPYVEFEADLSQIVNGVQLKDIVKRVIICRVEMDSTNRTVLASGAIVLGCKVDIQNSRFGGGGESYKYIQRGNYGTQTVNQVTHIPPVPPTLDAVVHVGEFPFERLAMLNTWIINTTGTDYSTAAPNITIERRYASFYAVDILYGNTVLEYTAGDKILHYSSPESTIDLTNPGGYEDNIYSLKNGHSGIVTPSEITISDAANIAEGGSRVFGSDTFGKLFISGQIRDDSAVTNTNFYDDIKWVNPSTLVIKASADITDVNTVGNTDTGVYNAQYIRPKVNKFGNIVNSVYISTGASLMVDATTPIISIIDVFGGDVFTQKVYVKNRIITENTSGALNTRGFGGGLSYYSQNYINFQLRTVTQYPNISPTDWLSTSVPEVLNYNGYNITDGIFNTIGFDPNVERVSSMPTRISYSQLKPQGSLQDQYRSFLPLNFKDLDLSFGEITHHANVNGELITWQPRKVQRQFFNTRSTFQGGDGSEVIIGDGTVLSRDGQTVTLFGSSHKWSIIKGKGRRGNDVMYWINQELKNPVRYAGDGPINLADMSGLTIFFKNNLRFVDGHDTPANGIGICGVWNDAFGELIWTVKGRKTNVPVYDPATTYAIDDVVTFFDSGVYEIYTSASNGNKNNDPSSSPEWFTVAHTNKDYYTEYTVVFSEIKNKFITYLSFLPNIYMQWKESYFTANPSITGHGSLYLHDQGDYCSWYGGDVEEDGHIQTVYNKDETMPKLYLAVLSNSEIVPERLDITTKDHTSYLLDTDFEEDFNLFTSSIKNDLDSLGSNEADTTQLWGNYIKIKFTFKKLVYQKIIDLVIKFVTLNRNYRK